MRVNKIIVHCSDSDKKEHDNIATIRAWHLLRGFDDVGYHFFIRKNGTIEIGRPLNKAGAHTVGQNTVSVGVCLAGSKNFTPDQMFTLERLCGLLRIVYGRIPIYPHRKFNKGKTCPNFEWDQFDN